MGVHEVSGVQFEFGEGVRCRSSGPSSPKMPGTKKTGRIVLRKVILSTAEEIAAWKSQTAAKPIARETLLVHLLDETGQPAVTWTLAKAWPTKFSGTDFKSAGNELVLETIEFEHEGLTIQQR